MIDPRMKAGRGAGRPAAPEAGASDAPGLRAAGALLRKSRLQQGFTIEEIAQATRIQRSHLEAIERGDADALPAGPFAKGFVTSYGRHLGVDSAELNQALERTAAPPPPAPEVASEAGDEEAAEGAPAPARRGPRALILAGVAAVAAALALVLSRGEDPPAVAPEEAPLLVEPVVEGGPRAESDRIVRSATVEAEGGQTYAVFMDLERGEDPHVLEVSAAHRSYLQVATELDGPPIYEAVLEAGASETFTSETELWVVFGNAGAVKVKYDGEALADLGLDGDRRGFAFRGAGRAARPVGDAGL